MTPSGTGAGAPAARLSGGLDRAALVVAAVATHGLIMAVLDTTIVNVALDTLSRVLHPRVLRSQVLEALEALARRSLLERGQQASFSLQSVVMEYLSDALGERLGEEIMLGDPQHLRQVALAQAQAKDYVREIQVRLLVHPLLEQLHSELGANAQVEAHLLRLLEQFRAEDAITLSSL